MLTENSVLALLTGLLLATLAGLACSRQAEQAPGPDQFVSPEADLEAAVKAQPEGTTFYISAGLHRIQEVAPKDRQSFIGEPGAVLSGAKLVTDFSRSGTYWVTKAGLEDTGLVHGECRAEDPGCAYPEDLFVDDSMLRQVLSLRELGPGKWFLDYDRDLIYLADDPRGRKVELSVATHAFWGDAHNITIRGLVIEKFASPAQHGAIHAKDGAIGDLGRDWLVQDNEIRLNHGAGLLLGARMQVLDNYIHHNGQIGITGGESEGILIEGNEISYNNVAGFDAGWEAGGTKFKQTRGLVVRSNHVHHNQGPGLWTDIDNIHTLYESNLVENNENVGILHEISYDAVIRDNTVIGNGFAFDIWLWGAGILIAASRNVEVHDNVVTNNADGIAAVQQDRGEGRYGNYEVKNLDVHDNAITMSMGETGLAQDIDDDSYFKGRNNRFSGNTYKLGSQDTYYAWLNESRTIEEWLAFGHDKTGSWLP
jgi:parallel beta-helix repeat protein